MNLFRISVCREAYSNFGFVVKVMGQKRNPLRIIIDHYLQVRFAIFVGSAVLGALVLVWISIEILLWIFIKQFSMEPKIVEVLKDVNFYIIYFFFWEGLLALGVAVLITLLLSRRVVGPIHRIKEVLSFFLLHKKAKGAEFRTRNKDEFKDLSSLVNKLIEELKKIDIDDDL